MLIILKSPKGESNHSLRTTLAMFPSLNVLTKLLFGISQKKNSGFVRFAHSILFNFQVPHLRYRQTGSRRCLVDSLFILPQLFPFVKRFLKISFRKFSKRSALLIFRKVFKALWTSVLSGVVPPQRSFRSRGDLLSLPPHPPNVKRLPHISAQTAKIPHSSCRQP